MPVKSNVEISQNFVAFSEYMNFTCKDQQYEISDFLALKYVFSGPQNFFLMGQIIAKITIICMKHFVFQNFISGHKISLFSLYRNCSLNIMLKNDRSAVTYGLLLLRPSKTAKKAKLLCFGPFIMIWKFRSWGSLWQWKCPVSVGGQQFIARKVSIVGREEML